MADDVAYIYRRYRPEVYWSKIIRNKPNHSRHNADDKTTKHICNNLHESCSHNLKSSNAAFQTSNKSTLPKWQDITITVKPNARKHKRKKSNGQQVPQRPQLPAKRSTRLTTDEYLKILAKKCSTPVVNHVEDNNCLGIKRTRSDTQFSASSPYQTKFILNTVLLDPNSLQPDRRHILNHPLMQAQLRIYRCQLSIAEESCCCSCNSDAMFEVMKSLYDCYKKKNCDHCNCVLCGHLPKEERKHGEARKSLANVGVETDTAKTIRNVNLKKAKEAGFLTPLAGKTPEQREALLRGLANLGLPLPEGKTPSLRALIDKVRKDLGLPPTPKSAAEQEKHENAAKVGLLQPLEGKSGPEKENILRNWYDLGIELPEGRTASEKSLIAKIKKIAGSEKPSQKTIKSKALGLLTPLEGKTPAQKEKILRGLALSGLPLPQAKTPSLKKIIDKVKKDLGLPPTPKSATDQEKQDQAMKLGFLQPLEGKSKPEKGKILQEWYDRGIELPEGRSPSEKALIAKIKGGSKELALSQSQKLSKAKAAGLLSPLAGKSAEEKENILRGLANLGLPLPEGKTPSLKQLIEKVRKELGLPPDPKSAVERKKQEDAANVGMLMPLEGKSNPEREKILQSWHDRGIELPEGRTPSEKALIANIRRPKELAVSQSQKSAKAKATAILTPLAGKTPEQKEKIIRGLVQSGLPLPEGTTPSEKKLIAKVTEKLKGPSPSKVVKATPSAVSTASEKLRRAKVAGLLTTLDNKTPEQKEKILRGLAMMGLPLPEGKSPSDIKLLEKVRNDLGMPPEPKNAAERDKYSKALTAGIIKPLEGKTPAEKEKILHALVDRFIPLPKGRTPSEKSLIKKILAETKQVPSSENVASEKLRKATLAGLSIPLQGKTPEQKEKMLRDIAIHGGPLPEGNTPSEIKLIDKVRKDLGLPPTPKTAAEKDKYAKAQAAGLIVPLEGKTPEQKEKILRKIADKSIPLPEGRTASEKSLIKKIQADVKSVSSRAKIASEKLRKAKASGLASSLPGNTPGQKVKMLHNLVNRGISLPEGKTASERALIDSVKKTLDEQTAKNMKEGKGPSEECICHILASDSISEVRKSKSAGVVIPQKSLLLAKDTKVKATGVLTPLESKSPADRERILRGLVKSGLPLPLARTSSFKALTEKIRKEMGLPPEPQTPLMKEKHKKAYAAGLISPLNSKTPAQRENVLKKLKKAGVDLPEGRTASEKSLIRKIKASKATIGIITPLDGKTPSQKENILKRMVAAGIPLPEGRTSSEKEIIAKLAKTPSAKLREAKAAGLLTPLKGKSPAEQEKILKGLLKAGLPLPEGTTPSGKALIKKVQDEFDAGEKNRPEGLSPVGLGKTDSEKIRKVKASGLITSLKEKPPEVKRRSIKSQFQAGLPPPSKSTTAAKAAKSAKRLSKGLPVPEGGDTRSKKSKRKSNATLAKLGAGIQEEIQEIVKTDKCDAACGCDKKKIRFKHSYVKIRVTSPDISSFCPCPNECVPGVKAGVFTDNEGIKVTVGSVGIPSYTVLPRITNQNLLGNKRSIQTFKGIDNLIQSQSLLLLNISLTRTDCDTDDSSSSKSTVYIFNSESDVGISDIERLLDLTLNNDSLKELTSKTSSEKKTVSYIYRPRFADSGGDFSSSLQITSSTLNLSTSSLRSLYTNTIYDTESCLSHAMAVPINNTYYSSDTLSKFSDHARHRNYSSQSINTPQSTERVDNKDSNTLPRKSKSYITFSNRKVVEYGESLSKLLTNGDTSCLSRKPLRGKENILELVQKVPSNKSLTSSSIFMIISSSGHGDSSRLRTTDALSNVTHSEPSSLLFFKNRPYISLLTLNMLVTAKIFSKAKAQRDVWKLKRAEAILRVQNMAQKIKILTQKELDRRRCLQQPVPVCTSNKYTSSTVASQEQRHVANSQKKADTVSSKCTVCKWNRTAYETKHIDSKIHSLGSLSPYCLSASSVSITPQQSAQVYVNTQVSTNTSVNNDDMLSSIITDNGPVKLRKTLTFAKSSVGEMDWNSALFSVHRMKTCY